MNNYSYTVFGLGNSSYTHFCRMGVTTDLELNKLGANRMYKNLENLAIFPNFYTIIIKKLKLN